jgi:peroxiredoxin
VSDPVGSEGEPRPSLQRLDPGRAASPAPEPADRAEPAGPADRAEPAGPADHAEPPGRPVIDTRPYRWIIGIIGLTLVVGFSVYQLVGHRTGGTGVAAGHRLRVFAAPLAATNLNGDANDHPTCSVARHDPRALNVCLMARRGPLVLAFFVTGGAPCVRQVSALQILAARYPSVQFAAVAINASHRATAAAVRAHHWTIPVAYDPDGRVGELYGVAACPMVELANRGGIVRDRLIGDPWQTAAALAPKVRELSDGA